MKTHITTRNNPNQEVFRFKNYGITWDDRTKHIFVSGGSGAGKTSSVLKRVLLSDFKLGVGCLLPCVKMDDKDRYLHYAKKTGRLDDVIVVSPHNTDYVMALFEYMLSLVPFGASRSIAMNNLLDILDQIINTIDVVEKDPFWRNEAKRIMTHVFNILDAVGEPITAFTLSDMITSMASSVEQLSDSKFLVNSYCMRNLDVLLQADKNSYELMQAIDYICDEVPRMAPKTFSSIKAQALGSLNYLTKGLFPKILGAEKTTLFPEMLYEQNKIIILDMAITKYGKQATIVQSLFIYVFMLKMLQRDLKKENDDYVSFVCDEMQVFYNTHFLEFAAVARSSRVCMTLATQSLAACKVKIGGFQANNVLEALIGNMSMKVILAHNEPSTNDYSSKLIGMARKYRRGYSVGTDNGVLSANASEHMEYLVQPFEIAKLKNGGIRNNFHVEGYVTMVGRTFNNGLPYLKVAFNQKM